MLQSQQAHRQQQMDDPRTKVQPETHIPRDALTIRSPTPDQHALPSWVLKSVSKSIVGFIIFVSTSLSNSRADRCCFMDLYSNLNITKFPTLHLSLQDLRTTLVFFCRSDKIGVAIGKLVQIFFCLPQNFVSTFGSDSIEPIYRKSLPNYIPKIQGASHQNAVH